MKEKIMQQFLDLLEKHGPMTAKQIGERIHLSHEPTGRRIREARKAGFIYACGYTTPKQKGEYSVRLWAIGPAPSPDLEDEIDEAVERQNWIAEQSAKTVPFRDPLTSAFFGGIAA